MQSASPGQTQSNTTSVRGVGTASVDARVVVRVIAGLILLALVGLAIATTISVHSQNSRLDTLRHHGVPVEATVTSCEGIGSGIGMGIEYYDCRGSYTLGGHRYDEIIGGNRNLLPEGQVVQAVAVPGKPALLSTAASLTRRSSTWTPYLTPILLAAVIVVAGLGYLWWIKRARRDRAGTPAIPATTPDPSAPL